MNSDPDRYLNRLVVTALTVFGVVTLLLAAYIFRELWLQQRMVGLSDSLQVNLEDLEETTAEIQSEMSEIRTTGVVTSTQEWEEVTELLEDVDARLESLGESIDEVAAARESELEIPLVAGEEIVNAEAEAGDPVRRQADQVFTIFAILVGIAAIAISILLGMAVRVQERVPLGESSRQ